jgi:hypothetical protein
MQINSEILASASYSARKLQFAIRIGLLPTPDELRKIVKKNYNDQIKAQMVISK